MRNIGVGASSRFPVVLLTTLALTLLAGGAVWLAPARAVAGKGPLARYAGLHPLNPHMGAFCYIDVAHVHSEWPPDIRVYRALPDKTQLFIGDPAALGYEGEKHAYFGPHPLVFRDLPAAAGVFCYLRGAHYHAHPPQPPTSFAQKEGVYWYTGEFPPEFARDYPRHDWINDVRGLGTYKAPSIDISAAPPGYKLPAVLGSPAVVPVVPTPSPAAGTPPKSGKAKKVGKAAAPGVVLAPAARRADKPPAGAPSAPSSSPTEPSP